MERRVLVTGASGFVSKRLASVEAQYLGTVRLMHDLHVAPTRRFAHLVIPEGGENAPALDVIVGRLLQPLGSNP